MPEYEKISDWLRAEVGSHEFINITELSALMKFDIFLVVDIVDGEIEFGLYKDGSRKRLSAMSQGKFDQSINNDPRGGYVNPIVPANAYGFAGYQLSRTLVSLLLPNEQAESSQSHGRGTSYRHDVSQLVNGGF